MEEIVAWKNAVAREHLDPLHPDRLALPDGMRSGLYKYIVFSELERSTGKVYDQPCHRIMGHAVDLPNSDWVAQTTGARRSTTGPRRERSPASRSRRAPPCCFDGAVACRR